MPYDIRKLPLLYVLASLLLVLVFLYWARVVLMPVALAVLLTFLLDPVVSMLERPGLPRTPAVILVAVVAFSLLGGIGWVVTRQGAQEPTIVSLPLVSRWDTEGDHAPDGLPMKIGDRSDGDARTTRHPRPCTALPPDFEHGSSPPA